MERVFSRAWPFGIVHQVWRGKGLEGACELQHRVHVLFNFINFDLTRKVMYELAGVRLTLMACYTRMNDPTLA